MLQFVNNIYKDIKKHKLIKAEKKILALISGGQDSSCLVYVLYLLQNQIGLQFDLIWFNHFWQRSSFFTMLHISKYSSSLALQALLWIPLACHLSEQSARDWRHIATQRTRLFYHYKLSVQGHNKSDRAETVLFNLIRGAGLSGVSSLPWTIDQASFTQDELYPLFSKLAKQTHLKRVATCGINVHCLNTNNLGLTKHQVAQKSSFYYYQSKQITLSIK